MAFDLLMVISRLSEAFRQGLNDSASEAGIQARYGNCLRALVNMKSKKRLSHRLFEAGAGTHSVTARPHSRLFEAVYQKKLKT
jgi:hypothetical protein